MNRRKAPIVNDLNSEMKFHFIFCTVFNKKMKKASYLKKQFSKWMNDAYNIFVFLFSFLNIHLEIFASHSSFGIPPK